MTGCCFYVGNTGHHRLPRTRTQEPASNEDNDYLIPSLIQRDDSSDEESEGKSNWMSTTDKMTHDKSLISNKNEPPDEIVVEMNNMSLENTETQGATQNEGGEPFWQTFTTVFEYYKQMNGIWVEPGGGEEKK